MEHLPPAIGGLTVTELNNYIKSLLDQDGLLQNVLVKGEISNWRPAASGHVYFTLKDESCSLQCVMWVSARRRLSYRPDDGDQVLAQGSVSVYPAQGRYQLYVSDMIPLGAGVLAQEFEALKRKLAAEGLFDEGRKRPLPAFPRSIGVATSPSAAAFQDILKILAARYPLARVYLASTLVQGEGAPAQIIAAIQRLNRLRHQLGIDVIIVARGGGSLEDLWAFNDEGVARAIAGSSVPIITGVGHETDYTIADFAADCRAPTPTAAAAIAVPDGRQLRQDIDGLSQRARECVLDLLSRQDERLERLERALARESPETWIADARLRLKELSRRCWFEAGRGLRDREKALAGWYGRLEALDPYAVLSRGYAIVGRRDDGRLITHVKQAQPGLPLVVRVQDGVFDARVE